MRSCRPALIAASLAFSALTPVTLLADTAPQPKPAATHPAVGDWRFDASGMDRSVRPGDNFFDYANGAWMKATKIPPDRPGWGNDYVLVEQAEKRVRQILEDPAGPGGDLPDVAKARAAYAAFMNEARVEALGAAPISADLAAIRGASSRADLAALTGKANEGFQTALFGVDVEADLKAPDRYAVYLGQGGLGMPDREYYLSPALAEKKAAYQAYIGKMLALAGWPDPEASAKAVVDFETDVAKASWALADRRDPDRTYHPKSPAELAAMAPGFEWTSFLEAAGLGDRQRLVVNEDTAVTALAAIWARTPLPALKAWAAFHVADSAAPYLSKAFVDTRFEFQGKVLYGQQALPDRWKRGVKFINAGMGEAVGKAYVERWFPPTSKAKIDDLVTNVRAALRRRILADDWMSETTKARAVAKLDMLNVKIGYPSKWRDYAALSTSADDLAGDARAFSAFEWRRQLGRLDEPVDRSEWFMPPQTVNAYYEPTKNEIVFPAAILDAPNFDPNADPAANYGGIGATIGHELTHGFDDEGRKYDGSGKLSDWWTADDKARFEAAAKALNAQYDTYEPVPGLHVKGAQTTGENIADLGGALVALDAYHASLKGEPAPVIDGLSGDQRFFLAFAQSWRTKWRDDLLKLLIASDVHTPDVFRLIGVTRNMDAWYAAFDVRPGETYYLAPKDRVRIW